jgi:hypothetical protein
MGIKIYYEFVNSQTGNIIGRLSLPADLDKANQIKKLEHKKVTLATAHHLNLSMIYWQDKDNRIQ